MKKTTLKSKKLTVIGSTDEGLAALAHIPGFTPGDVALVEEVNSKVPAIVIDPGMVEDFFLKLSSKTGDEDLFQETTLRTQAFETMNRVDMIMKSSPFPELKAAKIEFFKVDKVICLLKESIKPVFMANVHYKSQLAAARAKGGQHEAKFWAEFDDGLLEALCVLKPTDYQAWIAAKKEYEALRKIAEPIAVECDEAVKGAHADFAKAQELGMKHNRNYAKATPKKVVVAA